MENFIPNLSYLETNNLINQFLEKLLIRIKKKYNFINMHVPLVVKSNIYNLKDNLNRTINFDNKNTYEIYEIFLYYDNWIRYNIWYYKIKENDCVFSEFHFIERDIVFSKNNCIDNLIWSFELYAKEENRNAKFLESILLYFWKQIILVAKELKMQNALNLFEEIKTFSLSKLVKVNFLLNIKEILHKITLQKKQYILADTLFFNEKKDNLISRPIECYDMNNTLVLVVLDKNYNLPLNLLEITFRPDFKIFSDQIQQFDKEFYSNDFYNMLEMGNNPMTINLKINLTKLLYFLLNKQYIFEIPFANPEFNLNDIYFFFNKKNE